MNEDFKIGIAIALCCSPIAPPKGEPVAFIYGTPSESGNIGLRNGESVTLYDGAVLPPLPEWDMQKYPYAVIFVNTSYQISTGQIETRTILYCLNNPPKHLSTGGFGGGATILDYYLKDGAWVYTMTHDWPVFGQPVDYIVYTNFDMVNDDGILYMSASDPIPVSRIVGYSYNGTVLPPLPEWDKEAYPYAFIDLENAYMEATPTEWKVPTCYIFAKKPYVKYQPDNPLPYYIIVEPPYLVTAIDKTTGKWREIVSGTHSPNRGADWANYDVTADDDTLIIAASEPVPVYE